MRPDPLRECATPRITLLTTGLGVGGAEIQVVLLARALKRKGWRVDVVSMLPPEALTDLLNADSIPVSDLGMRRGIPDPRAAFRLIAHLRRSRPHVLHCHMVHANLLGRLVRPWSRVPVVISTAHSINEGGRWRELAYRVTDPLCDLLTQVSQAGARRYCSEGISSDRKTVWLPNGVDLERFRHDPSARTEIRRDQRWTDKFVWIAVGNLRQPKDYPNLLNAFAILQAGSPSAELAIVGTGSMEAQLRNLACELSIANKVHFLGLRTDVPQLLSAADAFVISSAWEGTPMALLEAASCSLPIVATSVGGNVDVIEHGKSGHLIPAGNSERLAAAMSEVMCLPAASRQKLGLAARTRLEKYFSQEVIVAKWDNIYRQLLSTWADQSRPPGGRFLAAKPRP